MTLFTVTDDQIVNGRLPEIPAGTTEIDAHECTSLIEVGELPASLEKADFSCCESLKALPLLPNGLKDLNCDACDIEEIGELPASLEIASFFWCENLKALPLLPKGLKKLNCQGCKKLEEIGELPDGLENLNLNHCKSLILTPELIERLSQIESSGCVIIYPPHFTPNDLAQDSKDKLSAMMAKYAQENAGVSFNENGGAQFLLHRFLTEAIGQRSNAANQKARAREIAQSTLPVLELLEKRPDLLPFVDELAGEFLAACVNQPVRGWSEISAWVSLSQRENIVDKLEAVKQVLALDYIVGFVREEAQANRITVGELVEAEAGNAFYREVHQKLLEEGLLQESWLGVSGPVAYEGTVRNAVTSSNVDRLCTAIKEQIMSLSCEQVAEKICEGQHSSSWGKVCFADEMQVIKTDYLARMSELDYNSESFANESKVLQEKRSEALHSKSKELTFELLQQQRKAEEESSKESENPDSPRSSTANRGSVSRIAGAEAGSRNN